MATSYSNIGGSGLRSGFIILTADIGIAGSYATAWLDGTNNAGTTYFSPNGADPTGKYIKFEFPEATIIDEAKWYQSTTSSHGSWKWQGSNNNSDWSDIGSSFTLGGATTQTQTQLNGNGTAYKYYRLLGISGAVSWTPYIYEIEFKINEVISGKTYYTSFGVGDRSSLITLSATSGLTGGTLSTFVNGLIASGPYFTGVEVSGKYLKFDFGSGNDPILTEAKWYQSTSASHGDWKWQGSNNDSDWTDIGTPFTLGGSTVQTQTQLSGNSIGYRYYRLLGISGNSSATPYLYEILFEENLSVYYSIDLASDTFNVSGTDLTLTKTSTLDLESGTITITGSDAGLEYVSGYTLNLESGSITLSGTALDLYYGREISLSSGSFLVNGSDVGLIYSGTNRSLSLESGNIVVSSSTLDLIKGYVLSLGSGSVLINGSVVTLNFSEAVPLIMKEFSSKKVMFDFIAKSQEHNFIGTGKKSDFISKGINFNYSSRNK